MKKTNVIVGVLAALALVVGVAGYDKSPSIVAGGDGPRGPQGERGIQGPQGEKGEKGDRGPAGVSAAPTLGSVTGPDLYSPYFNVNGVSTFYESKGLSQATTTVCSIRSPRNATSTLLSGGVRFRVASSSNAVVVDLARSVDGFASTTKIGTTYTVGAGAQATIIASSTGSVAGDATIFPPGTYFVAKMDNGFAATNNAPTGVCHATFEAY